MKSKAQHTFEKLAVSAQLIEKALQKRIGRLANEGNMILENLSSTTTPDELLNISLPFIARGMATDKQVINMRNLLHKGNPPTNARFFNSMGHAFDLVKPSGKAVETFDQLTDKIPRSKFEELGELAYELSNTKIPYNRR